MKWTKNLSGGFTLVEMLITISVFIIVGVLLFSILVNSTGFFYQQSSRFNQGLGINDSLQNIRENIKEADLVSLSYPSTGTPEYSSNAANLILRFQSIDSSGNKIFNVFDYIVYTVSNGKLYFKVYPDTQNGSARKSADKILSHNVSAVKFEYLDTGNSAVAPDLADKVKVTLTLSQKAGLKFETNVATSEANLRND
ncbi:hypothetical protein A3F00_03900 [Candidatus Daviesbacteria bacterium RIFCSPHIGHO2_12_FULL_37_11]|uniref:Type II secretion system protein J n=1 Tax=Candidatus Daviesbacteria bacterium RIFCSPHIGHO2_12_FULL_37_11 TaxID=1797777 RepID=A0A1F5KBN0_9BACT|nr:MAG: hypothetical protein A2111_03505 [Candidatus Daviesbacteria bacterium GWA1_38_6]OGE38224.1 MAG: hypothetical protein A3F00_03900 [Candidatus Daviesbacteria bacterium RIFCSPHIGHO2_12_FULL_37_11]OGE45896.1 MAG: hypothetical protein A3B39_01685 [Candidatus Daviesbacteria bacterium RIFCSPLOWO2_01_FULL_37_10]